MFKINVVKSTGCSAVACSTGIATLLVSSSGLAESRAQVPTLVRAPAVVHSAQVLIAAAGPYLVSSSAPPRGKGFLGGGIASTVLGLGFFVPGIILVDGIRKASEASGAESVGLVSSGRKVLSWMMLTPGLIGLGIGLPMVVAGSIRQARYNRWRKEHSASLSPVLEMPLADPSGRRRSVGYSGMQYRFRF